MTLTETLAPAPPPLTFRDGVLFVTGTRVPIDTIIYAYLCGETPKQIAEGFDTVRLENIYAVLSYYHRHQKEVETYLEEGRKRSEELRARMKPILPSRDLRDRLDAAKASTE